jgi:hypothetical protein
MHHAFYYNGKWDPVTTTWHVLSLWMEHHERLPPIHRKSSCGRLTQGGLQAWELSKGVTTPHHKNQAFYETFKCHRMLDPYTLGIIPHPVFHTVQQLLSNQHVQHPDGWIYLC